LVGEELLLHLGNLTIQHSDLLAKFTAGAKKGGSVSGYGGIDVGSNSPIELLHC